MLISNKKLPTIPKLFRVQLAHANTAHCEIKSGYKIINGGLGSVSAMVMAQPILPAHASTSSMKRKGQTRKSALIQFTIPNTTSFTMFCQQFR